MCPIKFKFKWDPAKLSLGIDSIDQQHQEIFDAANKLVRDLLAGTATESLSEVMKFLRNHTDHHFADEEALMEKINYPELEKHRQNHQAFSVTLGELERRFQEEGPSLGLALELNEKISHWQMVHIMKEDRAIVDYIKKTDQPEEYHPPGV